MEATLDRYIESTLGVRSGKPHIAGTRITVGDIKIMYLNMGLSLEEIAATYDLPLSAVYAAVAYYYDHKAAIDRSIEESRAFARRLALSSFAVAGETECAENRWLTSWRTGFVFIWTSIWNPCIAEALRRHGVNVTTTVNAGLRTQNDLVQWEFVQREHRVFVTHDDDFLRMASHNLDHFGIAYCDHGSRSIGDIVRYLDSPVRGACTRRNGRTCRVSVAQVRFARSCRPGCGRH